MIGVWSDADATEYPKAYIVPRGGLAAFKTEKERLTLCDGVQAWVRERVAKHKFLRGGKCSKQRQKEVFFTLFSSFLRYRVN